MLAGAGVDFVPSFRGGMSPRLWIPILAHVPPGFAGKRAIRASNGARNPFRSNLRSEFSAGDHGSMSCTFSARRVPARIEDPRVWGRRVHLPAPNAGTMVYRCL